MFSMSNKSSRPDLNVEVAFTGNVNSYTYLAGKTFFGAFTSKAQLRSVDSVKSMFKTILEGAATYGITPLESSSYGTIHDVYDRLLTSQGLFQIVGELGQIEQHCLAISPNFSTVNDFDVERVASHPHIMECCGDFLDAIDTRRASLGKPPMQREPVWDSAAGCQVVTSSEVLTACICSKEAAEAHNLKVIATSIGNYKNAEVIISPCHNILFL